MRAYSGAHIPFKASKISINDVSKETFELQDLGSKLGNAASEVTRGRGIVVLRGLDSQHRALEDNIFVFAGIASYFGNKRGVQGYGNNFLGMRD